ncbi:hypothetical protein ACHAWU_006740 [Discostella pseudostelligera]|uniref:Tyrosine specific protein phosphatases domain-containing protein n=1 Tax=Discostella pseudostelligera TaxID=259834 RepID=A0ABD3N969_9STRA
MANTTASSTSASSGNAMMMMPPRKLMPPVESSFLSSSDGSTNNNNNGSKGGRSVGGTGGGVGGGVGMGVGGGGGGTISSKPTLITTPKLRFLIMDAPRQSNLHLYIKECRRHHVTDIVRVCEPTYLGTELQQAGITLHEMAYDDGHSPPEEVLTRWLALVEERFLSNASTTHTTSHSTSAAPHATTTTTTASSTTTTSATTKDEPKTIAVHCVAGLGRAPVLVAIALMEYERMDAVDAVMRIRSLRRGAINETQLQYLEGYKCRTGRRKRGGGGGGVESGEGGCGCLIL